MEKTTPVVANLEKILLLMSNCSRQNLVDFLSIYAKQANFGIKFWLVVDVESKYVLNAILYLGKDDFCPPNQRLSDNVVMTLTEPFVGKGRNVASDNFFTMILLARAKKKESEPFCNYELFASAKC